MVVRFLYCFSIHLYPVFISFIEGRAHSMTLNSLIQMANIGDNKFASLWLNYHHEIDPLEGITRFSFNWMLSDS